MKKQIINNKKLRFIICAIIVTFVMILAYSFNYQNSYFDKQINYFDDINETFQGKSASFCADSNSVGYVDSQTTVASQQPKNAVSDNNSGNANLQKASEDEPLTERVGSEEDGAFRINKAFSFAQNLKPTSNAANQNIYYWVENDSVLHINNTAIDANYSLSTQQTGQSPEWIDSNSLITKIVIEAAVSPVCTRSWFSDCTDINSNFKVSHVTEITGLSQINMSSVIDAAFMFTGIGSEKSACNVKVNDYWASNTLTMNSLETAQAMFALTCINAGFDPNPQTTNASAFGISCTGASLTNTSAMFQKCALKFDSTEDGRVFDLSNFAMQNVINADFMFNASRGYSVNADGQGQYNSDNQFSKLTLGKINTQKLLSAQAMFNGCSNLEYLNLWAMVDIADTFTLKSFGAGSNNFNNMFSACPNLTTILVPEGTDWRSLSETEALGKYMFAQKNASGQLGGLPKLKGGLDTAAASLSYNAENAVVDGSDSGDTLINPGYFTTQYTCTADADALDGEQVDNIPQGCIWSFDTDVDGFAHIKATKDTHTYIDYKAVSSKQNYELVSAYCGNQEIEVGNYLTNSGEITATFALPKVKVNLQATLCSFYDNAQATGDPQTEIYVDKNSTITYATTGGANYQATISFTKDSVSQTYYVAGDEGTEYKSITCPAGAITSESQVSAVFEYETFDVSFSATKGVFKDGEGHEITGPLSFEYNTEIYTQLVENQAYQAIVVFSKGGTSVTYYVYGDANTKLDAIVPAVGSTVYITADTNVTASFSTITYNLTFSATNGVFKDGEGAAVTDPVSVEIGTSVTISRPEAQAYQVEVQIDGAPTYFAYGNSNTTLTSISPAADTYIMNDNLAISAIYNLENMYNATLVLGKGEVVDSANLPDGWALSESGDSVTKAFSPDTPYSQIIEEWKGDDKQWSDNYYVNKPGTYLTGVTTDASGDALAENTEFYCVWTAHDNLLANADLATEGLSHSQRGIFKDFATPVSVTKKTLAEINEEKQAKEAEKLAVAQSKVSLKYGIPDMPANYGVEPDEPPAPEECDFDAQTYKLVESNDSSDIQNIYFRTGDANAPVKGTGINQYSDTPIDVSGQQDKSILAYKEKTSSGYDLVVHSFGNICCDTNSCAYMFDNFTKCTSININVLNILPSQTITGSGATNMTHMFYNCSAMTGFGSNNVYASNFNTSNITDMSYMFSGCSSADYIRLDYKVDNSYIFDTSHVTNMSHMFNNCKDVDTSSYKFTCGHFNTANVTNMNCMFQLCSNIEAIDVSTWDVSKVTNMAYMFYTCSSITELSVGNWNTGEVTTFENTFYGCSNVKELPVTNFNTSKCTDMKSMFNRCSSWSPGTDGIIDFGSLPSSDPYRTDQAWNTAKVTRMCYMFYSCSSLKKILCRKFITCTKNGDGSYTGCEDMYMMFRGCTSVTYIETASYNKEAKLAETGAWVTRCCKCFAYMFHGCSSMTSVRVSQFMLEGLLGSDGKLERWIPEWDISSRADTFGYGCNHMFCSLTGEKMALEYIYNNDTATANKDWYMAIGQPAYDSQHPDYTVYIHMFQGCDSLKKRVTESKNRYDDIRNCNNQNTSTTEANRRYFTIS